MGEEVLSPTSPNLPHSTLRRSRGDIKGRDGQENTFPRKRRCSLEKPSIEGSGRHQAKGQNKPQWPGLNLVTNFSKPPSLAQRATDMDVGPGYRNIAATRVAQSGSAQKGPHGGGHANIDGFNESLKQHTKGSSQSQDHRNGSGDRGVTCSKAGALGLGLEGYGKPVGPEFSFTTNEKGPVSGLKRESDKWSALSPSDRMVVIGISIPSTNFLQSGKSPDTKPVKPSGLSTRQYAIDQGHPVTPTIVVTPAKEEAPWSTTSSEHNPPLPAYPSLDQPHHSKSNLLRSRGIRETKSRVESSGTIFNEDESPPTASRPRAYSGESQLRILQRSSTDTLATRHRSQGWWNHIVSPFLSRSNTMVFRSPSDPVPDLPSPKHAASLAHETNLQEPNHAPSPLAFEFERPKSGHTTLWTDLSRFEAERDNIGLAFDHTPGSSTLILEHPRATINLGKSSAHVQFEGFGEAAEYYQACWHDQNSPTPYFDCQNHSCLRPWFSDLQKSRNINDISEESLQDSDARHAVELREDQSQTKLNSFQQAPANRFSAAFKEAVVTKAKPARPISEVTIIEDLDTTPEVQEAHVAPLVRAGNPIPMVEAIVPHLLHEQARASEATPIPLEQPPEQPPVLSPRQPPAYSLPKAERPNKRFVAVMPPGPPHPSLEQPLSPEPMSAVVPRGLPAENAIPLVQVPQGIEPPPAQTGYIVNHYHGNSDMHEHREQVSLNDFEPPPRAWREDKDSRAIREKDIYRYRDERQKRKEKKPSQFRKCFKCKSPKTKKQKWQITAIAAGLTALVILILVLTMVLHHKGDTMPVQSQWLNITGYPPMPTGISTIVQPDAVHERSECVLPSTVWSCALPKEQQPSVAPSNSDQPNFRVEIRFRNGTSPNGTAFNTTSLNKRSPMTVSNRFTARGLIRRRLLQVRDSLSDTLYTAMPPPPSHEDQVFLGNTTDNNTEPFDGEYTPFVMSFQDAAKLPSSRLTKRDTNFTDPFPDLTKAVPLPDNNPDGTAAAANLLTFPSAQPLRLYSRGLPTEHYGFYTYFDRSIFLKSTALVNASSLIGEVPDDRNGGAEENAATVRCTWTQTRFLVQIWTNKGASAPLLQNPSPTTTSSSSPASTTTSPSPQNITASSANDFSRPGSFPYPVTITLDRHGGDIRKKIIYCYALDDAEHIIPDQKKVQLEDRAFGGELVNPALGPFGRVNVTESEGGPGGIDGGSGGCGCVWKNFNGS